MSSGVRLRQLSSPRLGVAQCLRAAAPILVETLQGLWLLRRVRGARAELIDAEGAAHWIELEELADHLAGSSAAAEPDAAAIEFANDLERDLGTQAEAVLARLHGAHRRADDKRVDVGWVLADAPGPRRCCRVCGGACAVCSARICCF